LLLHFTISCRAFTPPIIKDELLGEVRREVVAAHTRQAVAFQAAASFSSSSADCAPAAELEQTLSQLLALETAGHGNDYAARTAGGKVRVSLSFLELAAKRI